jgi:hypothetical protein
MPPPESIVTLTVRNARAAEVVFHLEPWGEEYPMPPGAAFQIVARGPAGQSLELEVGEERLIVYGWPGSVVSLFDERGELGGGSGERPPVPPTPPSMSVSTFMRTVVGSTDVPPAPPSEGGSGDLPAMLDG